MTLCDGIIDITDLLIQQTLLQRRLMDSYITNNKFQQRKCKAGRAVKKDGQTREES